MNLILHLSTLGACYNSGIKWLYRSRSISKMWSLILSFVRALRCSVFCSNVTILKSCDSSRLLGGQQTRMPGHGMGSKSSDSPYVRKTHATVKTNAGFLHSLADCLCEFPRVHGLSVSGFRLQTERGERANIAAIREKGTWSHTFWPGLSISRTFTTNAHNSKCMECSLQICVG